MIDYLLVFALGAIIGGVAALWWHFDRLIVQSTNAPLDGRRVEFKVDPAVLDNLNEALVMAWLDRRGLMWQPKGADFKVKVDR